MSDWKNPLQYPGSDVLVNRLGIRDGEKLRQFEYAAVNARLRELIAVPPAPKFDLDHLRAIHRHLFSDVYTWAGQTRDEAYQGQEVIFTKGGTLFALHSELKPNATKLFESLAKEGHLKGKGDDKAGFVERLSHYFVELNKIHPFPEGNGRATQYFVAQLAREAGYKVDYSKIDKTKWNLAARESAAGRPGMVVDVFNKIVSPERAVAFDKLAPEEAYKRHPELRDAFVVLANARRLAEQRFRQPEDQARFINLYRARISDELHSGNTIAAPSRDRGDPSRSR